jgi:glycosyltransferase involved in cell wall biosynthesis
MKIVFLTDGIEAQGSRYRCEQFFPYFRAAGHECDLKWAYGKAYNRVFQKRFLGPLYKVTTRLRRAYYTFDIGGYDLVFLQRTAFPQSALAERIAKRAGAKLVFDFDDSLWLGPGGASSAARISAFRQAIAISDHLIAGNEFLAAEADAPEKTTIIPTVIDTDRYVPLERSESDQVVIGWMGTAGNFPFVKELVPSLRRILGRYPNVRFRMVSNSTFEPLVDHPQVEQIKWAADTEIPLLQSFDIGLMPLVDSPLTRGKCAFKMIQYMSVGTPVVVSNVGANAEVFEDSGAGYLEDSFDWDDALVALIEDHGMRQTMGGSGRAHSVEKFSIHAVLPKYLEIFERVAG